MIKMFLLFSHKLTDEQIDDAKKTLNIQEVVYLPQDLQKLWSNVPADIKNLDNYLIPIANFLSTNKANKDFILIQGDFGATYHMIKFAYKNDLIPVYSTSKRIVESETKGTEIVKVSKFKHVMFRKYINYKSEKPLKENFKNEILNYLKYNNEGVDSYNKVLLEQLGCSQKTLERGLKTLEYDNILVKKKSSRKFVWQLKDKQAVIDNVSKRADAESIDYAIELSKKDLDKNTINRLQKMFETNSDFLIGHFVISDNLNDKKMNIIFDKLHEAIKNRYWIELELKFDNKKKYREVKPIRVMFLDNNWYLGFVYFDDNKEKFRLARLAFILDIVFLKDKKYSNKNKFQKKDINIYLDFLNNIQNSMTFYGVPKKIAKLKAKPNIARYFDEDMKTFLSSQKFEKKLDDGSIIFSIEYTNDLEVLPFIQKWLPDLIILSPEILRNNLIQKLKQGIENMEKNNE